MKKLPDYIKWIILFPASIIALSISYFGIYFFGSLIPYKIGEEWLPGFMPYISLGGSAYTFIITGYYLSPSKKITISLIYMVMGLCVISVFMLINILTHSYEYLWANLAPALGLVIGYHKVKDESNAIY